MDKHPKSLAADEFLPFCVVLADSGRRIARFADTLSANEWAQERSKREPRTEVHILDTSQRGSPLNAKWHRGRLLASNGQPVEEKE